MTNRAPTLPTRLARLLRRAADRIDPPRDSAGEPITPGCVRFFDGFANAYDADAAEGWPIRRYVAEEMSALGRPFQSALVVGVGTGEELEPLFARRVPDVEAIDVSENMLRKAREKYPSVNYHRADFLTFSGFRKDVYDLILCLGVVEYNKDFPSFLAKASRLLSPGGVILLTFTPILPTHPLQSNEISLHPYYSEFRVYMHKFEDVYSYVKSAGLSIRKCFTFDCHIGGVLSIVNLCFFLVLERQSP